MDSTLPKHTNLQFQCKIQESLLKGGIVLRSDNRSGNGKIRKAAVAGQFYSSSPVMLRVDVERLLMAEIGKPLPLKLLMAPHAGYVFSGLVAAKGYALLPDTVRTVFLVGPSYRQWFSGVHITDAQWYETPLGLVEVNEGITRLLMDHPLSRKSTMDEEAEHGL